MATPPRIACQCGQTFPAAQPEDGHVKCPSCSTPVFVVPRVQAMLFADEMAAHFAMQADPATLPAVEREGS